MKNPDYRLAKHIIPPEVLETPHAFDTPMTKRWLRAKENSDDPSAAEDALAEVYWYLIARQVYTQWYALGVVLHRIYLRETRRMEAAGEELAASEFTVGRSQRIYLKEIMRREGADGAYAASNIIKLKQECRACYLNALSREDLRAFDRLRELVHYRSRDARAVLNFYESIPKHMGNYEPLAWIHGAIYASRIKGLEVEAERSFGKAMAWLDRVVTTSGRERVQVDLAFRLGRLLARSKDRRAEAMRYLEFASERGGVSATLLLADMLKDEPGSLSRAIRLHVKGITNAQWVQSENVDPERAKSRRHNTLGGLYARQGLLIEAERQFKLALEGNAYKGVASHNLGKVLSRRAGRFEDARKYLMSAIQDHGIHEAWVDLGRLERRCGLYEQARARFETAKNLGVPGARVHLGDLERIDPTRRNHALVFYNGALEQGREEALFPLGTLLLEMGSPRHRMAALDCFKQCVSREVDMVAATMMLHTHFTRHDAGPVQGPEWLPSNPLEACWRALEDKMKGARAGVSVWDVVPARERGVLEEFFTTYIGQLVDEERRVEALETLFGWFPVCEEEAFKVCLYDETRRVSHPFVTRWLFFNDLLGPHLLDTSRVHSPDGLERLLRLWEDVTDNLKVLLEHAREWEDGATWGPLESVLVYDHTFPRSQIDRMVKEANLGRDVTSTRIESDDTHMYAERLSSALFAWNELRSCITPSGKRAGVMPGSLRELPGPDQLDLPDRIAFVRQVVFGQALSAVDATSVSALTLDRLFWFYSNYHAIERPELSTRYRASYDITLMWALELITRPLLGRGTMVFRLGDGHAHGSYLERGLADEDEDVLRLEQAFLRIFQAVMVTQAIDQFTFERHPTASLNLENPWALRLEFEKSLPPNTLVAVLSVCGAFMVWTVFERDEEGRASTRIVLVPVDEHGVDELGVPTQMRDWQHFYRERIEIPRRSDHQTKASLTPDGASWNRAAESWLKPLATLFEALYVDSPVSRPVPRRWRVRLADVLVDTSIVGLSHNLNVREYLTEQGLTNVPHIESMLPSIFSLLDLDLTPAPLATDESGGEARVARGEEA